jgi:hypothetical protein
MPFLPKLNGRGIVKAFERDGCNSPGRRAAT